MQTWQLTNKGRALIPGIIAKWNEEIEDTGQIHCIDGDIVAIECFRCGISQFTKCDDGEPNEPGIGCMVQRKCPKCGPHPIVKKSIFKKLKDYFF